MHRYERDPVAVSKLYKQATVHATRCRTIVKSLRELEIRKHKKKDATGNAIFRERESSTSYYEQEPKYGRIR